MCLRFVTAFFAAVLLIACGESKDKKQTQPQMDLRQVEITQASNGDFVLYVSNQSLDRSPIDITMEIDGKVAVSAEFDVDKLNGKPAISQHVWVAHQFQLGSGLHTIKVNSGVGEAKLEQK